MLGLLQAKPTYGMVAMSSYVFSTLTAMIFAIGIAAEESASKTFAPPLKPFFGAPLKISFPQVNSAPILDGIGTDACWREIRKIRFELTNGSGAILKAELKTCEFRGNVYLLLSFPLPGGKHIKGSRWRWDPVRCAYFINTDREPALVLMFTSESANFADVWVWRFERNDPSGFADDMFSPETEEINPLNLTMDAGIPPWFSGYFAEFAGSELPRFYSATPTGSAGDARGRCYLKNGTATIEFARKLKTDNSDDLNFSTVSTLRVAYVAQFAEKHTEISNRNSIRHLQTGKNRHLIIKKQSASAVRSPN